MKVLQINACYGFLSTGIIVQDIEKILEQAGHTAYVAYQQGELSAPKGYKVGSRADRLFHGLHTRVFGKQGYASKGETRKLLRWIDEIGPDIVHLHNLHSNYLHFNLLTEYLAKKNIKTVYTFHDCWAFTGKCTHYASAGCHKWKTTCGSCPQLKKEAPSFFFDPTAKVLKDRVAHLNAIADLTVVPCSNWMKEQVEQSLLTPKRLLTIYNGIDTRTFYPHESDFREKNGLTDEFLILGMANKWSLEQNKDGVKFLLENLGEKERIVLVGCNEAQKAYFSAFEKVLAFGFVQSREELAHIYAACDVFVNLTYEDTLPTVNMESLCCATPVITFDSCGSPELVPQGMGIVVPQGDFAGVLRGIRKIQEKGITTDNKLAQSLFDRDSCYQKYVDLYMQIIEDKR